MIPERNLLQKLRDLPVQTLRHHLQLPLAHEGLILDRPPSAILLNLLTDRELFSEATRLLSYALPEREAVWWACMCVRHALPVAVLPVQQEAAIASAEAWVRKPNYEMRIEAHMAGARAGYTTPAAWTAQAAFASRMPISAPTRTGKKVERAVARAAAFGGAERQTERLRQFIVSGCQIAAGATGRLPPEAG
jgi:hypothetical protein